MKRAICDNIKRYLLDRRLREFAELVREGESKKSIVRGNQDILATVELVRHWSISDELVHVGMPQRLARGRVHRQEITDGITAEQNITCRGQQAGYKIAGSLVSQFVSPDDLSSLVVDGHRNVFSR